MGSSSLQEDGVGTVPGWHLGALLAPCSELCPAVTPGAVPEPVGSVGCTGLGVLLVSGAAGSCLILEAKSCTGGLV